VPWLTTAWAYLHWLWGSGGALWWPSRTCSPSKGSWSYSVDPSPSSGTTYARRRGGSLSGLCKSCPIWSWGRSNGHHTAPNPGWMVYLSYRATHARPVSLSGTPQLSPPGAALSWLYATLDLWSIVLCLLVLSTSMHLHLRLPLGFSQMNYGWIAMHYYHHHPSSLSWNRPPLRPSPSIFSSLWDDYSNSRGLSPPGGWGVVSYFQSEWLWGIYNLNHPWNPCP
jgi:hypothetical protein